MAQAFNVQNQNNAQVAQMDTAGDLTVSTVNISQAPTFVPTPLAGTVLLYSPDGKSVQMLDGFGGNTTVSAGSGGTSTFFSISVTPGPITNTGNYAAQPNASANTIMSANTNGSQAFDLFRIQGTGGMSWGSGTAARDVNLYRGGVGLLQTDNTMVFNVAGNGIKIAEGSNAKMGTATANGTTAVVVSTTAVTANSRIFLTAQNPNAGTPGALYVSAISAGTSFSIKSTSGTDASTVAWLIVDHT